MTAKPTPAMNETLDSRWLGAPGGLGLRLPDAQASIATVYAPRGACWTPDGGLLVTDTGNHRVLGWHRVPDGDHAPADFVLLQKDAVSEGAQAAGRGPGNGCKLPTGILVTRSGALVLCDAWNHRLLVWDRVPTHSDIPPDRVIGQPDLKSVECNRGEGVGPMGLNCPYGAAELADGRFLVADTSNRRVLVWERIPLEGEAPVAVLGQDDFVSGEENRGRGVGADTFRWPHDITECGGTLVIADAGNHRVMGWLGGLNSALAGDPPDVLLGQKAFDTAFEMPHVPQGPAAMRFPYSVSGDDQQLLVADTANNRVLRFAASELGMMAEARGVLGQADFNGGGENRWDTVAFDTLCWPYGLTLFSCPDKGDRVAIADSGNNRVMVHTLPPLPENKP